MIRSDCRRQLRRLKRRMEGRKKSVGSGRNGRIELDMMERAASIYEGAILYQHTLSAASGTIGGGVGGRVMKYLRIDLKWWTG